MKRFSQLTQTASEADLVAGNFLAIDVPGVGGVTKKLPGNMVALKSEVIGIEIIDGGASFIIKAQTFLSIAVAKGAVVSVTIDPAVNGFFSVALGNNDTYTQGGTTTLVNAGTPHTFSYTASADYTQMRINNINNVNAAVTYSVNYGVPQAVFDAKKSQETATGLSELAMETKGTGTLKFSTTGNKDMFIPKGCSVSFSVTNNGAIAGYFGAGLRDKDGNTIKGFAGQLINAGDTYSYTGPNPISTDCHALTLTNTNSQPAVFSISITENLTQKDREQLYSTAAESAETSAGLAELELDATGNGSVNFSASDNLSYFIPKGRTGTLSIKNNGSSAGYFSAGFQDKDNATIYGFGGQLIAAGATYTYTGAIPLSRDCYSIKITNTNLQPATLSVSVDADLLQLDRKNINNFNNFAKSFYDGNAIVNVIDVNADGSMDFTDIQSAINSVTDASPTNLYEIRVHSDFKYTTLTDLYKVATYAKNTEASPTAHVAAICGKDYVRVVGWGSKKTVEVVSPLTITGTSLQWVQVAYPMGNFTMKNLHLKLTGGRYAIHQESGGNEGHLDINATTIYEDLTIEHCGNADYPNNWTSQYAMASGTASGSRIIYRDCLFISRNYNSPFFFHSNKIPSGTPLPREITFERCHAIVKDGAELTTWDNTKYYPYFGEIGAQAKTTLTCKECDFTLFATNNPNDRGSETETAEAFEDVLSFMPVLKGYGNKKFQVSQLQLKCLCLTSASDGDKVIVTGGTAYGDIWGGDVANWSGSNAKGITCGKRYIANANSLWSPLHYTFTLAYRLGNCAANNKTLVVNINGTDYTVTFDKNYMTADGSAYTSTTTPAYTNDQILGEINTALGGLVVATMYSPSVYQTFEDCKEETKNTSGVSWVMGDLLVRDFIGATQRWKKASAGDIAEGVVLNRIDDGKEGEIFLASKSIFPANIFGISGTNSPKGRMFKVGASGLEQTNDRSEASFIALTAGFLEIA